MIPNNQHHKRKAQQVLSFIVAFIAIVALIIGIIRIWMWFHANYAKKVSSYQNTRLDAGTASQYGDGSSETYIGFDESPLDLTESWVFEGQPSGTVGSYSGQYSAFYNMGNTDSYTQTDETYMRCYVRCQMLQIVESLRETAEELYDAADDCDDAWDGWCWWTGGFGETADDLEDAADEIVQIANEMEEEINEEYPASQCTSYPCSTFSDSSSS